MMNANEAKRMTNEVREAEAQKTREAARQTCETAISKRIEDAARNGYNTAFHGDDKYICDKEFYRAVEQYLEDRGYKVYQQNARVITIEW